MTEANHWTERRSWNPLSVFLAVVAVAALGWIGWQHFAAKSPRTKILFRVPTQKEYVRAITSDFRLEDGLFVFEADGGTWYVDPAVSGAIALPAGILKQPTPKQAAMPAAPAMPPAPAVATP